MKEMGNPLTEKHCCLALIIISILNTYPLEAATNFFMSSLLYIQELKLTLTATTKNVIMDLSAWHCRNLAGVHLFLETSWNSQMFSTRRVGFNGRAFTSFFLFHVLFYILLVILRVLFTFRTKNLFEMILS